MRRSKLRPLAALFTCWALIIVCFGCGQPTQQQPGGQGQPEGQGQPKAEAKTDVQPSPQPEPNGKSTDPVMPQPTEPAALPPENQSQSPPVSDVDQPDGPAIDRVPDEAAPVARSEFLDSPAKSLVRTVVSALSTSRKARARVVKAQIGLFKVALGVFQAITGKYPTTEHGLAALLSPPAGLADADPADWPMLSTEKVPLDPWGSPYRYESPGRNNPDSYDVWSIGADKVDATEDDVGNWDAQ